MTAIEPAPVGRRTVLRAAAGAATATLAPAAAGRAAAASADGWLDPTGNFDGTVADRRGEDEVRVSVGARGNGGGFAFDPPAVRVDPGATVVWEWTGDGGSHNVVDEDGAFESELTGEKGYTFSWTFEERGVTKYACVPHRSMGMRGAVLVGDAAGLGGAPEDGNAPTGPFDGWLANTGGFESIVDATGRDRVEIEVGAEGNGGQFAFDPPAVRVDPGATVVWRWLEGPTVHHVVAADDSFWSPPGGPAGGTFARTFDDPGVVEYACPTYEAQGMRGVVVVGDPDADSGLPASGDALALGGGLGLVAGLFALLGLDIRGRRKRDGTSGDAHASRR